MRDESPHATPDLPVGGAAARTEELAVGRGLDELAADFEILGELGRGGSAVVYHARDRHLGRDVALKVVRVPPALAGIDQEPVARLAREARTIARLEHPGIVRVHAVRELRDGLAVVMPRVEGRTLKQLLHDEGPLTPERAAALLADVADALAYAHAAGVVHRDVKPENVFIDAHTGRALLADFGVARAEDVDTRLTQTGVTIGTPAYMSPEQIDGHHVDGRSDLYSLGLLGWELLTGRRPWEGEGLFAVLQRQKRDLLPPIEVVRPANAPAVPLALQYVIERLLQKSPAARWAGADAVAAQLRHPVLPADFAQWRRAHGRRVETARAESRPPVARGLVQSALATIRFTRGAEVSSAPASESDATPAWMTEPPPHRRRVLLGAGLGVAVAFVAVASVALPRLRPSRPDARIVAGADAGRAVVVPVGAPRDSIGAIPSPVPQRLPTLPMADGPIPASGAAATASAGGEPVPMPAVSRPAPAVRSVPAAPALAAGGVSAAPLAPIPDATPVAFPGVHAEPLRVAAGGRHSCALLDGGRAACWGANGDGQLGTGDDQSRDEPTPVESDVRFVQLAAGGAHSCALSADGDAWCWGSGDAGQLGTGATASRPTPARVPGAARLRAIRAGLAQTCALAADGAVLCWGANESGQLGDGSTRGRATPAPVRGLRAAAITVGWRHACALAPDGAAWCWGANADGQLGDGTRTARPTPVRIGGDLRFVAIAAGAAHTCALAGDGSAFCWGRNANGQLGTGTTVTQLTPAPVRTSQRFAQIVAGSVHSCARSAVGLVSCWGGNAYGQLGDGTTASRLEPVRVSGGPYVSISATGAHTCAATGGASVCWGYNVDGQLGDGTRAHRSSPMRVTAAMN